MFLLALFACADQTTIPDTAGTASDTDIPTWHADVAPLITEHCAGCHTEGGIGGFTLTSLADVQKWSAPVYSAVASGTMPPWGAADDCNTYERNISMPDEDVQTILRWIDAGLPEGDPADAVAAAPYQPPTLDRVDLSLQMPVAYTPVEQSDDYRCFILEWPYEETVWVTGYELIPGNAEVVHHVIPFIISPEDTEEYLKLDEADPEPGYTCYGSPGGSLTTLVDSRWLGAWAPGGGASTTPAGTGLEMTPGSLIVMQMHYNTSIGADLTPDRSELNFRVETEPQGWANMQPWTNPIWLAGVGMEIPANTTGVTHTFAYDSEGYFAIQSATLHMHTLGVSARMFIDHADGSQTCLAHVPQWDFNWQRTYDLAEPAHVNAGDTLTLECTWDNPTDSDVAWGEGTSDEMCLGITLNTAQE